MSLFEGRDERTIEIGTALDAAGKELGPPWQKDHRLAAVAAWRVLNPTT